jgi:hypothetical protein
MSSGNPGAEKMVPCSTIVEHINHYALSVIIIPRFSISISVTLANGMNVERVGNVVICG